ncbi:MAG: glucose-6-phosphate isomerase [Actinobacteria bacterium]|nr:glucose-6-phosphate isomerase [Actinomycetota bacterium]
MKDLRELAGLPLALDERGRLLFSGGLPAVEPAVRKLAEVREVLADPGALGPEDLYFMYRDVGFPEDKAKLHKNALRYDVTVILPCRLGREFNKTAGHYHPMVPGTDVTYPEVYEVINGVAHYLLQKPGAGGRGAEDVVVIVARAGDKVLVPPGYGHITINPGPETLVMTNLVEAEFRSVYDPIREGRGGAYYEIEEDGNSVFVVNESYPEVPELRVREARPNPECGLVRGVPLYRAAVEDPAAFEYLVRPQDFLAKLRV